MPEVLLFWRLQRTRFRSSLVVLALVLVRRGPGKMVEDELSVA